MRTIYLINNKEKEPDFALSFEQTMHAHGVSCIVASVNEFAFFSSRYNETNDIWFRGEKLRLDANDLFFMRKSFPHGAAVTLLAVVLKERGIPFTDETPNLLNSIRTSKLTQSFELKPHDIAFPDTWVVTPASFEENKKSILTSLSFPLVMKMKGGLGQKVWKCENEEELSACIATNIGKQKNVLFLLQEFIKNSYDLRILVYKNTVLASIKRSSTDGFHNNVSQGGSASAISSTVEEQELALRATKELRLDFAGVDIVRTSEGPLVFEVNKAPDVTSFNEAAGTDLAARIAEKALGQ